MSIQINESKKIFTLHTEHSTYQMQISELGHLLHLYYGKKIEDMEMSYLVQSYDRGFSGNPYAIEEDRTYSLDTLPQEFSSDGVGDFRIGTIEIENSDGSHAFEGIVTGYKSYSGKYSLEGLPAVYQNQEDVADTLEITLKDRCTDVEVVLYYGVIEKRDIITRAVKIINSGTNTIKLRKALSLCMDFSNRKLDLIQFYGRHAMERLMERQKLRHGTHKIGSVRGTSSHHYNPFIILCDEKANEEFGDCYGFSFVYSGNFISEVEVDQIGQTRVTMGIHPRQFYFELKKDEEFVAPEVICTYSANGLGELSRNYHNIIKNNICRGQYKDKMRPVLVNNWEATYFDFDEEKILALAKEAVDLGIDLLVLDDGWFGKRDSDTSGLGDWTVNTQKIKCGLKRLGEQINEIGLKFGLWFEPEMISEDSDLYRSHPEWRLSIPERAPNSSRHQFVLDLSRADVCDYIIKSVSDVLESAPIDYVKWDMNRSLSDVWSHYHGQEKQGEIYHRYVLGLYKVLEAITSKFPHVLFEGCSGGGGRFDAGVLYYTPQIWCSDNTDAIDRLKIQHGTSFGYPVSTVGAHVSACPNHQSGRTTPINTRAITAMAGSFGYELDLGKLTEKEKNQVRNQIIEFKKYYNLIHKGDYYRLTNPNENERYMAWQFVSKDKTEALINIVVTHVEGNDSINYIKIKGLDPLKLYKVSTLEKELSGAALMNAGLPIPMMSGDYPALQIHLVEHKKA